jgi:hypothetical protein
LTPAVALPQLVSRIRPASRMADRMFFAVMILVMWGIILFGFSRTYFLAGMVAAPLPNLLIHLHGAAFTLWMVLLVVQSSLIVTHNVRIHRTLGMAGFGLAAVMVVLGILAAVDALKRGSAPLGLDAKTFFVIPMSGILVFPVLIFLAYRMRNKVELHKRLILIATIELTGAGVGRWPIAFFEQHPPAQDLVPLALLGAMVVFDMTTLRRVSKATIWGSLLLIVVHATRVPIGRTATWHAFASFLSGT